MINTKLHDNSRERISARVSHQIYAVISKAAEVTGQTINSFMVQSALQQAQDTIDKHNMQWINVTEDQAGWLQAKLEEPAIVNPYLQDALRLYEETANNVSNISNSIRRYGKTGDQ